MRGERPFLLVQTCLGNDKNVALWISTMQEIARSQNMAFIDGSKATQGDMARLKVRVDGRLINISIERRDGMGLMAGNLGLTPYEVAIGFSEGSNPIEAHQFADLVVKTLKQRWDVQVVPSGLGSFPMKGCGVATSNPDG